MLVFANKIILITGASSGIGKALATQMSGPDVTLILVARKMDELKATQIICESKGATCFNYFAEMTSQNSLQELVQTVMNKFSHLDILINNAGISQRSQAEETGVEVDRKIMEVNFFAPVTLTKLLWPMLLKSKHANVVLISSVVGTFGFPQRSAYSASKHAIEGFFESWMLENTHPHIHFTTVSPGRIYTNISYAALKADGSSHQLLDDGQAKGIKPEVCAKKIIKGIESDARKVYVAQFEMVLIVLRKYFPFAYFKLVKILKLS